MSVNACDDLSVPDWLTCKILMLQHALTWELTGQCRCRARRTYCDGHSDDDEEEEEEEGGQFLH